jgi:hypothetical protein
MRTKTMMTHTLKATAIAALIGLGALTLPAPAQAGNGRAWGAGLVGFGIGAIVGSALAPREVYVAPPPDYYDDYDYAPAAYGPVYGPPPWTAEWYAYCANRYRSFNARTGTFMGYDGQPHFCQ